MQVVYLPAVMKIALATIILFHAVAVHALDTAALLDGSAAALLEKNCIRTDIGGMLPVRFGSAINLLGQPDLILYIQEGYWASISKDEPSGFPIVETESGAYHYVNEKNQCIDLFELHRKQTTDRSFDLIYLAKGKRYFGKYEVLIHIRAIDAAPLGTLYIAEIHAYPRNVALRFFARRFGTVERYFEHKTRLIARLSNKICINLEDTPAFVYQPANLANTGYESSHD